MYEELLIGNNPQKTVHPKIQKIKDPFVPFNQLDGNLSTLKSLIYNNQVSEVKKLLRKMLKSFKSNSKIVDHIYLENKNPKFKKK